MPLNADQWIAGQPVILERCVGRLSRKVQSRILGAQFPSHLLVELPLVKNRPIFSPTDTHCIVRFIKDGMAIGFRSRIISTQMAHFPFAVLEYPAGAEIITVRRTERIECCLASLLTPGGISPSAEGRGPLEQDLEPMTEGGSPALSQSPLHGLIVNLSVGGCQIGLPVVEPDQDSHTLADIRQRIATDREEDYRPQALSAQFFKGRIVSLRFEIPQPFQARFESVASETRWARIDGDIMLMGMKFTEDDPSVSKAVGNIIRYHQTYFQSPVSLA